MRLVLSVGTIIILCQFSSSLLVRGSLLRMPFYAVRVGRKTGIYQNWSECEVQVKGFSGARYAKFDTIAAARCFLSTAASKAPAASAKRVVKAPKTTRTLSSRSGKSQDDADMTEIAKPEAVALLAGGTAQVPEDALVVYTDGACPANGRAGARAGYGVHFPSDPERDTCGALPPESPQTSQRAELTAILKALELTKELRSPLEIRTDSAYSIGCLTNWFRQWEQREWSVNRKNLDLIRSIIEGGRARSHPVFLVGWRPSWASKSLLTLLRGTSRGIQERRGMRKQTSWQ